MQTRSLSSSIAWLVLICVNSAFGADYFAETLAVTIEILFKGNTFSSTDVIVARTFAGAGQFRKQ